MHLPLETCLCSPEEPELEDVVVAAALDRLVASVVRDVVVLVGLEEVVRLERVARLEPTLQEERRHQAGFDTKTAGRQFALFFVFSDSRRKNISVSSVMAFFVSWSCILLVWKLPHT